MPNNCYGTLTITANSDLLKKILDTVRGTGNEEDNPLDFEKIIPMPESEEDNWYDWCCENWGTKWNSCDTTFDRNTFFFWTAWSPCSPVIKKLAEMFPEACFDYWYDESGMGFCGQEKYEDGKLIYIMEADMSEQWIYDEDDPPADFKDGQEVETKTVIEENDNYKTGKIVRIIDEEEYRTLIEGFFCEGKNDNLRDKLYETIEKKGACA